MPVDDYYSLIGVSADADRDEIKEAYRSRRSELADDDEGRADSAKLNRAWNVLSDQAQRDRYDDQLAEAKANDDVVVPELVGTPATNGSGPKTRGQQRRDQAAARQAGRTPRQLLPMVTEVNGVPLATNRERIRALGIDAVLCLVILILGPGLQGVFPGVAFRSLSKSQKPEVVHKMDQLNNELTATQKRIDAQVKARDQAKTDNKPAVAAAADKAKKASEKHYDQVTKDIQSETAKLSSIYWMVSVVFGLLLLLIFAVPSARSGRSPGKALGKIRLVRAADGAAIGWSEALKHYGVVIGFIVIAGTILGPPAWIVALFGVTSFIRNPKRQGWHDRIARTVVAQG
jgi:curved DNA-binding protein CbpA